MESDFNEIPAQQSTPTDTPETEEHRTPPGPWRQLIDLVGGRWPIEKQGTGERIQMALRAGAATLLLASAYGIMVGSTDAMLALNNAWKLPGVLMLSSLTALPAGALTMQLLGHRRGTSTLFTASMAGNFAGALVLAALAPLVTLYYQTSTMMGAPLAMLTGILAVAVGASSGARLLWRSQGVRKALAFPTGVLVVVQMLAMLQYIHLASPILPESTIFSGGIEGLNR